MQDFFAIFARGAVCFIPAVLCAAGLSACGGGAVEDSLYPAPGRMEVVSLEPVEDTRSNVIRGGDFEKWWSGAPLPEGNFYQPVKRSSVKPVPGNAPTESTGLRQTWHEADSPWLPEGRFGFRATGLRPHSRYELTLHARTNSPESIKLLAHGVRGEQEQLVQLAIPLLEVTEGSGWQELKATFETGVLPDVHFTTALYTMPAVEGGPYLELDNISVVLQSRMGEPTAPAPTADNLIANGSFEVWPNGVELPLGPFQRPDNLFSTIEPHLHKPHDGRYSVHQIWTAHDREAAPNELFGVAAEVNPQTDYIFRCHASRAGGGTAAMEVYGKRGEEYFAIATPLFTIDNEKPGFVGYEGRFNSGDHTTVVVVVRVPESVTKFSNRVVWDNWRLEPAP
jgi:hypothetical protein